MHGLLLQFCFHCIYWQRSSCTVKFTRLLGFQRFDILFFLSPFVGSSGLASSLIGLLSDAKFVSAFENFVYGSLWITGQSG